MGAPTYKWGTFSQKLHEINKLLDESNEESDAKTTANEWNINNNFFIYFSLMFPKLQRPGEGYIASDRSPTGVTDQHAANQPLIQ